MIVRMTLLTDTIFGNGASVPGAEDISVLCDRNGFPYFKGSTFKGIFREEFERLLDFKGLEKDEIRRKTSELLGEAGDDEKWNDRIIFSDFCISHGTKEKAMTCAGNPDEITAITTNVRAFTAIEDNGIVKTGSLRMARCVDRGISFYSRIECPEKEKKLVIETLGMIKWIGTMRNRGFGKVKIDVVEEAG